MTYSAPIVAAIALALVAVAPAQDEKARLADDLDVFRKSTGSEQRGRRFERILAAGKAGAESALRFVDERLADAFADYTPALQDWLKNAYPAHLIGLDYEQIVTVQRARRLWRSYVLHGGHRKSFQDEFLTPMQAAAEVLLLQAENVSAPALKLQRAELVEFAGYREKARKVLGIDPDPTIDKRSPTDIPYPRLDQPPTFLDDLHHTERTLVLACTVAPPGARPVLLFNDVAAREIDVQEAEYVLFGNEMRLLAGTIAWQVDPLGNAVARDHSNDRTKGLAKGHMSSIPEKRGFTHRSRRMGARRFGSEGVGGGSSGRGYIRGLSYGGGHTGPLYSLKRNIVGVGRRGGAYTSIYATDRAIVHACQAVDGELALPPGWDRTKLRGTARKAFARIQAGKFGSAYKVIEAARPANEESAMLLRFLKAAIEVEVDWALDSAAAIEASGDLYEAQRRLLAARQRMKGIVRFDAFAEAPLANLARQEFQDALRAGESFQRIVLGDLSDDERQRAARTFAKRHRGTIYATAIKNLGKEGGAFAAFLAEQPTLEKFDYPPRVAPK
ncbi:MAG: hypothetical protein ACI89X_002482 [Planctomycetota bacterium]|jgi:hypothetical protein